MKYNTVEKLLKDSGHVGAKNSIGSKQLAYLTGHQNVRMLQSTIQSERENNALILSSTTGGYFLPSETEPERTREIETYIRSLRNRALNTLRIIRTAKRALSQPPQEQMTMFTDAPDVVYPWTSHLQ